MAESPELLVCHLGRVELAAGRSLQRGLRANRLAGAVPDVLLLLDHPLEEGPDERDEHPPGRLVGYPIIRVRTGDRAFARQLAAALLAALGDEGIQADGCEDSGRVRVGERTLGSISVGVTSRVSHGSFALNVDNLNRLAVPGLTSISREIGRDIRPKPFRRRLAARIAQEFGLRPTAAVDLEEGFGRNTFRSSTSTQGRRRK